MQTEILKAIDQLDLFIGIGFVWFTFLITLAWLTLMFKK